MGSWTHSDPYGLWARSEDALDRCHAELWLEGDKRTRGAELRALLIRTGFAGTLLVFQGRRLPPGTNRVDLSDLAAASFPSADHLRAYRAVTGWAVVCADGKRALRDDFVTEGGVSLSEAGSWPLVLARVAGTAIWAAACCYIAERYESTIARFGDHAANTAGMMKATSTATTLVEMHAAREAEAGASLPWSPEEKQVLDAALLAQATFANKPVTPPDSHPSLGSGIGSFSTGAIVALAAVGYFMFGEKTHEA